MGTAGPQGSQHIPGLAMLSLPQEYQGPGSGGRDGSLSVVSGISRVPRSSAPCPLHKCNFPKCQEESITDNTLYVSLTQ